MHMANKLKWVIVSCLIASGSCLVSSAQEAGESTPVPAYTLNECIEIGLERSIPLANSLRDEEIAKSVVRQIRAQVFPQLNADGRYTRLDELQAFNFGDETFEVGKLDNYHAALNARQLLYSGGSVNAGLKAAKAYRDRAKIGTRHSRDQLIRDIRVSFYDLLLAKVKVAVQEESVAQLKNLANEAEEKHKHDTISEFDLLSAKVRLANEEPLLIRARNDLAVEKAYFKKLLQWDIDTFEIQGELTFTPISLSLERLRETARVQRPEIQQQIKLIEMRESDVRAERGKYMPQVYATGSYQGENPSSTDSDEDWRWSWNVGLALELAILDGGLRRAHIREKYMNLAKAQANLQDIELGVDVQIQQYYLDVQHAAKAYLASKNNVELAEKSMTIADTRYQAGLSTYLEYTDTNLALSRARLTRATALRSHMTSLANLQYASGLPDEEFLKDAGDK